MRRREAARKTGFYQSLEPKVIFSSPGSSIFNKTAVSSRICLNIWILTQFIYFMNTGRWLYFRKVTLKWIKNCVKRLFFHTTWPWAKWKNDLCLKSFAVNVNKMCSGILPPGWKSGGETVFIKYVRICTVYIHYFIQMVLVKTGISK